MCDYKIEYIFESSTYPVSIRRNLHTDIQMIRYFMTVAENLGSNVLIRGISGILIVGSKKYYKLVIVGRGKKRKGEILKHVLYACCEKMYSKSLLRVQ